MDVFASSLEIGEEATIINVNLEEIPLKLLEMGCLPGNKIMLLQIAPFGDPLYFNVNDSHVAIRLETAKEISISKDIQ
jgi:ferrous iron transport protein A